MLVATLAEEKLAFYAAIGEGITEWSHIEDRLYMILLRCMNAPDHRTVGAAFYAMDAFRTKLSITDAVAPTTLGNRRRYKFTSQRGIGCEER
jgi:hypothetical protein